MVKTSIAKHQHFCFLCVVLDSYHAFSLFPIQKRVYVRGGECLSRQQRNALDAVIDFYLF